MRRVRTRGVRGLSLIVAFATIVVVAFTGCRTTTIPTTSPIDRLQPPSTAPDATLAIDTLPRVDLRDVTLTAVCDPSPGASDPAAGEATIGCSDGLELGLRALRTATSDPIERLYLRLPTCRSIPCSSDELRTADVVGWTRTGPLSIHLDSRLDRVTVSTASAELAWPATGSILPGSIDPRALDGAPPEVANRAAYPSCGRADVGRPPIVLGCFRSAVLAGREAEMVEQVYSVEGESILWLYRYAGDGAVIRYERNDHGWSRMRGALILGRDPMSWSFEPIWGTDVRL